MGTVRLVDVETAKVITSTTFVCPITGEEADIVMKQVAQDIVNSLLSEKTIIHNELPSAGKMSKTKRQKADKMLEKIKE